MPRSLKNNIIIIYINYMRYSKDKRDKLVENLQEAIQKLKNLGKIKRILPVEVTQNIANKVLEKEMRNAYKKIVKKGVEGILDENTINSHTNVVNTNEGYNMPMIRTTNEYLQRLPPHIRRMIPPNVLAKSYASNKVRRKRGATLEMMEREDERKMKKAWIERYIGEGRSFGLTNEQMNEMIPNEDQTRIWEEASDLALTRKAFGIPPVEMVVRSIGEGPRNRNR
jgi:hypothetical protein